jgi:hypothetical protein
MRWVGRLARNGIPVLTVCIALVGFSLEVSAQESNDSLEKIQELESRIERLEEQVGTLEAHLQRDLAELPAEEGPDTQELREPDSTSETHLETQLSASLANIQFHESSLANDYANDYTDWISLRFEFTNGFDRDIRAVKGTMVFKDLFGDPWWRIGVTVNDEIPAGETIVWDGTVDYSIWDDAHGHARHAEAKDVEVEYVVDQVLFSDGTRREF